MKKYTPLFDDIVKDFGIVGAAVYGYVWRQCQKEKGVCGASFQTIADDLGLGRITVINHMKRLVEAGQIVDTTPHYDRKPHEYLVQEMYQSSTGDVLASTSNIPELVQEMYQSSTSPVPKDTDTKNNNNYELTGDENFAFSFFEGATGFCPPHQSSSDYHDHWLVPIRAIVKKSNGRTEIEDRIAHAVHQMQGGSGKTYTIKSPKSILTFALNWGNEPSPNSNGHNGIAQPPAIKPATAEELAEFQRMAQNTEAFYGK